MTQHMVGPTQQHTHTQAKVWMYKCTQQDGSFGL